MYLTTSNFICSFWFLIIFKYLLCFQALDDMHSYPYFNLTLVFFWFAACVSHLICQFLDYVLYLTLRQKCLLHLMYKPDSMICTSIAILELFIYMEQKIVSSNEICQLDSISSASYYFLTNRPQSMANGWLIWIYRWCDNRRKEVFDNSDCME